MFEKAFTSISSKGLKLIHVLIYWPNCYSKLNFLLQPVSEQLEINDCSDVATAVRECVSYCKLRNINNPVDILKIYQNMIVTGRPLDLSYETESTGIEGDTNFIMIDRSNLTQTAFDEISSLTDLRKCLEVQFYDEVRNLPILVTKLCFQY